MRLIRFSERVLVTKFADTVEQPRRSPITVCPFWVHHEVIFVGHDDVMMIACLLMSTPDFAKPWFIKFNNWGGTPPIVISSNTFLWYPPN